MVEILQKSGYLYEFLSSLQSILNSHSIDVSSLSLPIDLLEPKLSFLLSRSVETSFSLQTRSCYPLQAILYNCNTLTFHEEKEGCKDFFIKHATIQSSINERVVHKIFSHKNMTVDFFVNLHEKLKDRKTLPNILIMEVNDLMCESQNDKDMVIESYLKCQAIVTSSQTELFCPMLYEILETQSFINKNEKPIFVISPSDMGDIQAKYCNGRIYKTINSQLEELLNTDLIQFGGFKEADIIEY